MKRSLSLLIILIVTAILSGCILSNTPNTNPVIMKPDEQKTFSITAFPTIHTYYSWTLDGAPIPSSTGRSYTYTAQSGEHVLMVSANHIISTDTQTWNITCRSLASDLAKLYSMKQEILNYIGDASCSSAEECRYIAIGEKPCGGPWGYLVYCAESVNEDHLNELITAYNEFEHYINMTYQLVSDCMYVMPPELVWENGHCIAGNPGSLASDRAKLYSMGQEILNYIGDASCSSAEECRYIAIGEKPCGGPWGYLIYCAESVNEEHLNELITAHNEFEHYINMTYQLISDCMFVMPPEWVWENGHCIAKRPEV